MKYDARKPTSDKVTTCHERVNLIGLLRKLAPNTKGSMLQDVENRRQTEIDVMCGAIVERERGSTSQPLTTGATIGLIKGLEGTFNRAA